MFSAVSQNLLLQMEMSILEMCMLEKINFLAQLNSSKIST